MASRYKNNEVSKLQDGRVVYRSKIYPSIPLRDDDVYVVTQTGDRLDTIAHQFLGDQSLWWIIAAANNVHGAFFALDDGTVLRIPSDFNAVLNLFNS